ncbi:MAG TPA: DUF475 domain-containing protein [Candidatus Saccharimonadales bacterium]|nr:DUF475 domain-containing protein [Candidatus Saccharimonadales bacterium]
MSDKKPSLARIYAISTLVSLALIAFVGARAGLSALILVLVLAALEITFSVDNAVINTRILQRMSPAWQQAFLTVGIFIAVFIVRVLLPLYIVVWASGLSISTVTDLALNHPEQYGEHLSEAHPVISAFGGIFLLMIFLDFFFEKRRTKWLKKVETLLQNAGKLESLSVIIALGVTLWMSKLVGGHEQHVVLTSGIIGLFSYLAINSIDTLLEKTRKSGGAKAIASTGFKAGLIGFLYLNMVDASFSLDGVIGAFAITNQIFLIAVGLGIGALYVRVLTLHMLRHGVLEQYKYMEHGAHYAIGILALIMLLSLKFEISEFVAGLAGVAFIATAVLQSYIESKRAGTRA